MKKNPSDDQPQETHKDFFKPFRFTLKSGLYLPKTQISDQRVSGSQQTARKKNPWRSFRQWLMIALLAFNAYIYWRQANIMDRQVALTNETLPAIRAQGSADIGLVPVGLIPPCTFRWNIVNSGQAKARNIEIESGVKRLPSDTTKIQFMVYDATSNLKDFKKQREDFNKIRQGFQQFQEKRIEILRAAGWTEDKIEAWKAWDNEINVAIAMRRRFAMELPRNTSGVVFDSDVCENVVKDASTSPFLNILLYSFEDDFGLKTGETCVGYFPADQKPTPCTVPVPLPDR
jgi:hypothetical protein